MTANKRPSKIVGMMAEVSENHRPRSSIGDEDSPTSLAATATSAGVLVVVLVEEPAVVGELVGVVVGTAVGAASFVLRSTELVRVALTMRRLDVLNFGW